MPDFPSFDHWFPPRQPPERRAAPSYTMRRPAEEEVAALDARLMDWLDQRGSAGPGRAWARHIAGTSWLAAADLGGRPLGVLLGFASPGHPDEAVISRIAVDPEFRRRGIGRALVGAFADGQAHAGASRVTAACRPDNRPALAFFAALGFAPNTGPGSRKLYGVPAFQDWDGPGEDRAILERAIGA